RLPLSGPRTSDRADQAVAISLDVLNPVDPLGQRSPSHPLLPRNVQRHRNVDRDLDRKAPAQTVLERALAELAAALGGRPHSPRAGTSGAASDGLDCLGGGNLGDSRRDSRPVRRELLDGRARTALSTFLRRSSARLG